MNVKKSCCSNAQEPNRGFWSPCGGKLKMDIGESPYACACREAHEEIGLGDPKGGAAGGALNLLQFSTLNHQCEIMSGVRLEECRVLLQSFFAEQRQAAKAKKNGVEPPG